ncbi:MAG: hypothetical protein WBC11_05440 [Dehalococcoidia bacterium]
MLEVKVTTIRKAKSLIHDERTKGRKHRKKSPIMKEYEEYLTNLERGKAITITLNKSDKYQTIKYRLNNAAKSLGIKNFKIERAGSKVIFYKEVRPRARKAAQHEAAIWPVQQDRSDEQNPYESEYEPESDAEPALADATQSTFETTATEDLGPTLTPGQKEELLAFDFDEEWEEPMIHGQKTCEAHIEEYTGNTFKAFGHNFVVTEVEQLPLGDISQKWFKQHGLFSPREFQEIWKQRHKGEFDAKQLVWLHHFKRGFEPPIEPDSDIYLESEVQD